MSDQHRLLPQTDQRPHVSLRRQGIPKSSLPTDFLGTQFTRDLVAGVAGPDRTAFSAVPQCALTEFSKKRLT